MLIIKPGDIQALVLNLFYNRFLNFSLNKSQEVKINHFLFNLMTSTTIILTAVTGLSVSSKLLVASLVYFFVVNIYRDSTEVAG